MSRKEVVRDAAKQDSLDQRLVKKQLEKTRMMDQPRDKKDRLIETFRLVYRRLSGNTDGQMSMRKAKEKNLT